jgi:hypothetical protein
MVDIIDCASAFEVKKDEAARVSAASSFFIQSSTVQHASPAKVLNRTPGT